MKGSAQMAFSSLLKEELIRMKGHPLVYPVLEPFKAYLLRDAPTV
jgi:hypothetical protein